MDDKCILDPQRDCIGKAEAAKLEGRIKALEEWKEDSKKFHNDFYDWQREQIARDVRLDEKLGSMEASLSKLVSWQETEREKPGKRWGVYSNGRCGSWCASSSCGVRPALVLPSDFRI